MGLHHGPCRDMICVLFSTFFCPLPGRPKDRRIHLSQIKSFGGKGARSRGRAGSAGTETRPKKTRSPLKTLTIVFLILAALEGLYFTCVYSNIPFIAKWRTIYIQTAMDTMRHQWLATAFIPQSVIDEAMSSRIAAKEEQTQHNSSDSWADGKDSSDRTEDSQTAPAVDTAEEAFYELFWELDRSSMEAYLKKNPSALDQGWDNILINEAGLDDEGTAIQTTMGEQVLAIDAQNQILLLRVKGSGYRGVLAVAKDPSRLSVKNSTMLGSAGQYAGTIAQNNGGILAMTGSSFIDEGGVGNGGILAGYAMSDGQGRGAHMGWSYKRLELREDNYLYIVDAQSEVHPDTTDAVEFTPAIIIDGNVLDTSGWNGLQPRAILGQSDRGEILMLVVEGRLLDSIGISVADCAPILLDHNCMQALNLDGGTSAIMWYDGEYITRCSNTACPEGRPLPNAFVYEAS